MKNVHNLIQSSPEWHTFRAEHFGASEAAAMLGLSKYTSRAELLHQKHTGLSKDHSAATQAVFARGHETEALARPIVERIIGDELSPITCSDGKLSCSCDGITFDDSIAWEHKQWNSALANAVAIEELPEEHKPQCQQVLMITGARKLIFTVSDGTTANMVSMDVFPDKDWFERIKAGWAQFEKDLESYQHIEHAEKPKAEVTIELPALFVHAKGEITTHNMDEFGNALTAKLAEVRAIALVTDQDFSNAKESAKKFRETAKAIKLSKEQMLAQTETIGEAARKMDAWAKDLNETALQLEKDVEREDMVKKRLIVAEATTAFNEHVAALEAEIKPISMSVPPPDFSGEIKGKRNYASMQNAVDTALANGKIAADAQAKDYRAKLDWCKENAAGMSFLFPDLQQIISKPMDDFTLTIASRITAHKKAEADKLEAERARIQAEEEAKAQAKAKAEQDAIVAKAQAEERANVEAEAKFAHPAPEDAAIEEKRKAARLAQNIRPQESAEIVQIKPAQQSDEQDARRYRYLRDNMISAEFDWNESGETVLVFKFPGNVGIGGDCDKNIDAAIAAESKVAA